MTKDKEQSVREFWIDLSNDLKCVSGSLGNTIRHWAYRDSGWCESEESEVHVIEIEAVESLKQQLAAKDKEIAAINKKYENITVGKGFWGRATANSLKRAESAEEENQKLKEEIAELKGYKDHIFDYAHKEVSGEYCGLHIAEALVKEHKWFKFENQKLKAKCEGYENALKESCWCGNMRPEETCISCDTLNKHQEQEKK